MTRQAIELWDWQAEAVDELRANIAAGVKNQVLASPTGSGKTIIATYMMQEAAARGTRCVFVCDRIALIDQTSAVLDSYGIDHGVIQANHWRWRPWMHIQVASAQTIARREWPDADLIIVDECHTVFKTVAERIKRRDAVTIGLSATPLTRGLGKLYDDVVTVRTLNQLTDDGYLAPWVAYSTGQPDMEGAKVTAGEWTDAAAEERAMPIVGDAVEEYLRHASGRKFIAFGSTVRHCEALQRQFMEAGIRTGLYTYKTPDIERKQLLLDFAQRESRLMGMVSVAALAKGFDAPNVECIIMCRPLRSSLAEHIQILGRGLRRDPENPDKTCIVLDHAGNMQRFWYPMMEFFENGVHELDDGKRKKSGGGDRSDPPPKTCPKCEHIHAPRPRCPMCGHEYPKPPVPEHAEGSLTVLGNGKRPPERTVTGAMASREQKQKVWSQLLYIADERGYKKGWAAHNYRDLFGVWPRGLDDRRTPPARWIREWVHRRLKEYAMSQEGDKESASA